MWLFGSVDRSPRGDPLGGLGSSSDVVALVNYPSVAVSRFNPSTNKFYIIVSF